MKKILLHIEHIKTHFPVREGVIFERTVGVVKAVDGVTLSLPEGEVLGLVGESGCGKSTLARTVVQLTPATSGTIAFQGQVLNELPAAALRELRPRLQMIFQDPYASLNPRRTVFDTLAEPMLTHRIVVRGDLAAEVGRLMETVGLAPRFMRKYPHEFSGGQRQRIAVARALALRPRLVLADEPVSALDVSVQAQILNLLKSLKERMNLTMMLISHDLSVVRHMAQRIAVMYLGKIVEIGATEAVFEEPRHPYTQALLSAIPSPDPGQAGRGRIVLEGDPPSPLDPPTGCSFHPRCPYAAPECAQSAPALEALGAGHEAACLRLGALRSDSSV